MCNELSLKVYSAMSHTLKHVHCINHFIYYRCSSNFEKTSSLFLIYNLTMKQFKVFSFFEHKKEYQLQDILHIQRQRTVVPFPGLSCTGHPCRRHLGVQIPPQNVPHGATQLYFPRTFSCIKHRNMV